MITSIRFLQQNIHERKDFATNFRFISYQNRDHSSITTISIFFSFFEFYQIHKDTLGLHVGRVFQSYLSAADKDNIYNLRKIY